MSYFLVYAVFTKVINGENTMLFKPLLTKIANNAHSSVTKQIMWLIMLNFFQ